MLPKEIFKKLIFPIGNFTKDEVRKIAKKNKLSNHAKPGNADLCFLDTEKGEFIRSHAKSAGSGNIVDAKGDVLGQHTGIEHYTVGQRRGLGLKNQTPLYVADIKPEKNEIVVGEKDDLFAKHFYVGDANWVSIDAPKKSMNVEVLVRNKAEPQKAKIVVEGKRVKVVPAKPVWAVSPGQIAVFLKGDVVLGGGWIL
jgi:tRNA-specific 2-thiouridylase